MAKLFKPAIQKVQSVVPNLATGTPAKEIKIPEVKKTRMPVTDDPNSRRAQRQTRNRMRKRRGRSSTILSDELSGKQSLGA